MIWKERSTGMDNIQDTIATNLYNIRKSRNLTYDQLSQLTGVSKAMLIQIEKGKSNPTVSTLYKIADGLHVSFSTFMKKETPKVKKIHFQDIEPISDDEGNFHVYSLFPFQQERKFEVFMNELMPGCTHQARSHIGEEYILVKEGRLTFSLEEEKYELDSGDALQFNGTLLHSYQNTTNEIVRFFSMVYYPDPE